MADVIRLKDITVFGFYGVSPAEREVGQKIQIDLEIHCDLSAACRSDSLQDTINYESIYGKVMEVVGGEKRYRLLESLGDEIVSAVVESFPVSRVEIRLRKLNLPFPTIFPYVEVFLARRATPLAVAVARPTGDDRIRRIGIEPGTPRGACAVGRARAGSTGSARVNALSSLYESEPDGIRARRVSSMPWRKLSLYFPRAFVRANAID